jgi:hypothetical protein
MLEQRGRKWLYAPQQTQKWLIWLAGQMKQHQLTEFYLERLQATWLSTKRLRIVYALLSGLVFGLVYGLLDGGEAYLQHYCLRYLLWRSGVMPLHYVRFLNEATERILLQPVGGGYRFIHPLFQEYFASLDAVPPANEVTPPTSEPIKSQDRSTPGK